MALSELVHRVIDDAAIKDPSAVNAEQSSHSKAARAAAGSGARRGVACRHLDDGGSVVISVTVVRVLNGRRSEERQQRYAPRIYQPRTP